MPPCSRRLISVTAAQMREIDSQAAARYGIASLTLMENAGRGTVELILEKYPTAKSILIFCGKGNNGGDGFVIARLFLIRGFRVQVILLVNSTELKGDAKINFERIQETDVVIQALSSSHSIPREISEEYDLIIDALLGTGLQSEVRGIYREAIEFMNASGKPVVAVDIPSGLDADEGKVMGVAVKASHTATMGIAKQGLFKGKGPEYCGQLHIIDLGLPQELLELHRTLP